MISHHTYIRTGSRTPDTPPLLEGANVPRGGLVAASVGVLSVTDFTVKVLTSRFSTGKVHSLRVTLVSQSVEPACAAEFPSEAHINDKTRYFPATYHHSGKTNFRLPAISCDHVAPSGHPKMIHET